MVTGVTIDEILDIRGNWHVFQYLYVKLSSVVEKQIIRIRLKQTKIHVKHAEIYYEHTMNKCQRSSSCTG